jgi:hypothetical protein
VRNGNTHEVWINAPNTPDLSLTNTDASANFNVGSSGGTLILTGQMGPVFVYTAALGAADIKAQYRGGRKPVRLANIWHWNSGLLGSAFNVDQAGVSASGTVTGTIGNSTEDPGIPWERRGPLWLPRAA